MDFFSSQLDFIHEQAESAFSNFTSGTISKAVESTGFLIFGEPSKQNLTSKEVDNGKRGSIPDADITPSNKSGLKDGLLGLPALVKGYSMPLLILGGLVIGGLILRSKRG